MPPKRRKKTEILQDNSSTASLPEDEITDNNINNNNNNQADGPSGSQKPEPATIKSESSQESLVFKKTKVEAESEPEDDSNLPECPYGESCYRKNPQHFREMSHPNRDSKGQPKKKSTTTKNNNNNNSHPKLERKASVGASGDRPELISYRQMLASILDGNTLSVELKRAMRNIRRKNNISDEEHQLLVSQFGWTLDEIEDGIREQSYELIEEKQLMDSKRKGVIWVDKKQRKESKEKDDLFSRVCTRFYDTMSVAQANYSINKVGLIVNPELSQNFSKRKAVIGQKFGSQYEEEEWGFHGTSPDSILKIADTGFLLPDELKQLKKEATKKKTGPKKQIPVELLDEGYYGKGIYFTLYSDYALWYADERESNQIMLVKMLPGKKFQCTKRMDGQGCKLGYSSHISPKKNEIVLFEKDQILPRYIIEFSEKVAEEREQEG